MYRATINDNFFLADYHVPKGTILCEDVTASAVLTLRAGRVEPCESLVSMANPKTFLITRPGGIGDLIQLTPLIRELHSRGIEVSVSTHVRYHEALLHQPCVLLPYPLEESVVRSFDAHGWMENSVENADGRQHLVDTFAERAGITVANKQASYIVTDEESDWASERFPRTHKPRIAVQSRASSDCRNVPDEILHIACSMLIGGGCEVVLVGAPGSIKAPPEYLCLPAHGLSFRQSMAVVANCDACISPDSSLTHAAGAMGIPCLALFGPFAWESRTKYAPKTFALSGKAPCAPCFHHARTDPWVAGKPCSVAKRCVALAEIKPEDIVRKVKQMIER